MIHRVSHVTFDFERFQFSDTFQLQLQFSKFISTLQLKPELSNSSEIFQFEKKLSNFRLSNLPFPTSYEPLNWFIPFVNAPLV